jgi:hypothetical protein
MKMMNRFAVMTLAALAFAATAGCGSDDEDSSGGGGGTGGGMQMQTAEPSAESKALWTKIQGYSSWAKFSENQTPVASKSHMDMYVVTHHNDIVADAITNNTLPLPDGSILVKDNFPSADATMPMAVTVMSKEGGEWYWLEATPDGKVVIDSMMDKGKPLEGKGVMMCVGCHDGAKDNDQVFTHKFGP